MVKELLLAILAFAVTALVIIILMTAVGNTLFPSAVSIVENRLERIQPAETPPPSPVSPPEPPVPESAPAPAVPRPAPEPAPDEPPADPAPPDAPEPIADVPPGDGGLPEDPEAPAADADEAETPTAPSPPATQPAAGQLADDPEPGEILPLSDGRVAYKVQSGDTFSQICKKVVGTGRQQVWQKAAEMMNIDYRTIRPGRVLIFDAEVLALGEEE